MVDDLLGSLLVLLVLATVMIVAGGVYLILDKLASLVAAAYRDWRTEREIARRLRG